MLLMKRSACALFLILMVLNTIGYYSFLVLVKDQRADRLTQKIAAGAPEPGGDLILKIPLSLPYVVSAGEYQSSHGEFTYEGTVYRVLKQRHYNDTLYIVGVHDDQATSVANQLKDLSHAFAGESKHAGSGLKLIDSLSKYYCITQHTIISLSMGWSIEHIVCEPSHRYTRWLADIIFHPPENRV
jgi:hypothetical protein